MARPAAEAEHARSLRREARDSASGQLGSVELAP